MDSFSRKSEQRSFRFSFIVKFIFIFYASLFALRLFDAMTKKREVYWMVHCCLFCYWWIVCTFLCIHHFRKNGKNQLICILLFCFIFIEFSDQNKEKNEAKMQWTRHKSHNTHTHNDHRIILNQKSLFQFCAKYTTFHLHLHFGVLCVEINGFTNSSHTSRINFVENVFFFSTVMMLLVMEIISLLFWEVLIHLNILLWLI